MIGAGAFAIAIGLIGYWLGGWIFALGFVLLFLVLLPPLNLLVVKQAPEDMNVIVAFQAAKWALAGILVALMLTAKWTLL